MYNSREKILNDVIDWNILTNSSTGTEIREFEYLAPLVDSVAVNATSAKARDNIRCVEKQLCEVVCIFGGRFVVTLFSLWHLKHTLLLSSLSQKKTHQE